MIHLAIAGNGGYYDVAPSKIVAVGLNYREHVAESKVFDLKPQTVPTEPVLFAKTPNVLIGTDQDIVLPDIMYGYGFADPRVDLEAELAVIIGKRTRRVTPEEALSCVYGYTCFNDVSQRDIQKADTSGWFRGKSFDTFGPIGPVVVPAASIPDPNALAIMSRVNGVVKQRASTADMIFSVAELIAFISRNLTLEVGDIIATGTPSGVCPIHEGDLVEIEIERIGVLRNTVRQERI